jgi:RHS repeat-associated protein
LRTYGNGTKAEYEYDDANRLTLLANKKSDDTVLSSFTYEVDKTGNRTKRTRDSGLGSEKQLRYTYDNIYEITEVYQLEPSTETLETFSYDNVGNRTTDADYSDYSYNSNNQLTSYDSMALEYDKNGNLTKRTEDETDITMATFDYENRLVRIDYPNEEYSAYKYDALGRRIEQRMRSGNIRRFYYDQQNLIAAYDGSNALLATATFGPGIDQPISLFREGENYYYHSDALGSIYQMTDSDQDVVKGYDYSAFGKIIAEAGAVDNTFTYTGREYDSDSGLYYYRARYYDADIGRFLSRDIEKQVNLYVYVWNEPISSTDPLGLFPCREKLMDATNFVNGVKDSSCCDYDGNSLADLKYKVGWGSSDAACGGGPMAGRQCRLRQPDGSWVPGQCITICPSACNYPQDFFDCIFLHELGHGLTGLHEGAHSEINKWAEKCAPKCKKYPSR